jgi:small GTP-binding protein
MDDAEFYSIKIITVGNAYSGKTSITNMFCNGRCDMTYQPTIGVEFSSTYVNDNNGDKYKLMFWDTAGQETFAPIIKSYYKNIAGLILVIDLSDEKGLQKIDYWLNEYNKNRIETCETKIIILGNKSDLSRKISKKKINMEMQKRDLKYCEVSAKNGKNIHESIMGLFKSIIREFDRDTHPGISNLKKKYNASKKKRICAAEQKICCNIS